MTRGAAATLAAAFAIGLAVLAACAAAPPTPPLQHLRLVTWNIHHGAGLDGKVDLDRIADELHALAPDVVCLQEVDVGIGRSDRLDIPAELARRLQMHAAFGKNIDYQGGDYGNAILSRWPIVWQRNRHYRMLREGEQRGLLLVGLDAPAGELRVGCTHLDYRPDAAERLANAEEIAAELQQGNLALIAGDFNDRPGSALHQRLGREFVDAWPAAAGSGATYPAAAPDRRIDWVLLTPRSATVRGAEVPATAASDHRPVLVEVALPLLAAP